MNWIKNMNEALYYIEDNIENDVTSDEIAKVAMCSKFHFMRMFSMLTGMSLGEYIRLRKLSLATKYLICDNEKIITIAMKLGYETPESFSKAFKKLHGVSPSKVRKENIKLKAIPPLSFQITVKGEDRMNYSIQEKEPFKIVGVSRRFNGENGENFRKIPLFWDEVFKSGKYKILEENAGSLGVLGVCTNFCQETKDFDYLIAVEGNEVEGLEGPTTIEVPKLTWAIFESIGPLPESIQNVTKKIFTEWFPATGYEHACGPEIEVYYEGDPQAEDYRSEVWVPIVID
ncbi:AraC family transcriptional regulator [Anaeromicrobium sediminis]|uniref:AraC family transcriptional regulator n=1 Tax=Anaeromicrobium sediminis TaxID=1478221 RepID=A0A267MN95_9FIRM|nr:AraC family transcriptional regulator [Anaeromicrobium sediminis]PAB61081.1 AraC family transcriptional regulator [Anaeromicrobium sediminis]